MKHIVQFLRCALILLVPAISLYAAEPKPEQTLVEKYHDAKLPDRVVEPMLWRVTGNGLAKPSWLFGTIHISDKRVLELHPSSLYAFQQSDRFYTEVEVKPGKDDDFCYRTDRKTLSQQLPPELYVRLKNNIAQEIPDTQRAAYCLQAMEKYKTWLVAILMPIVKDLSEQKSVLDSDLHKRAISAGKKCGSLETPASQGRGMDLLSEKEQQRLLDMSLADMEIDRSPGENKIGIKTLMLHIYLSGNENEFSQVPMTMDKKVPGDDKLGKKLDRYILSDRNPPIAKNIIKNLKAEPGKAHFFAIGVLHYSGEHKIQDHLEKAGYKIERIYSHSNLKKTDKEKEENMENLP